MHGIQLSGTVGCLVLGVKRRLWTLRTGNDCLSEMIEAGFFSPLPDLAELLG